MERYCCNVKGLRWDEKKISIDSPLNYHLSCSMTKPTKWHVRPVKTNPSSLIESSLCTQLVFLNPHLPSGPVHPYQLDESISNFRGVWWTLSFLYYFEYIFLLANSGSVASDLSLHFLPMSQKWDARFIWVTTDWSSSMWVKYWPFRELWNPVAAHCRST